MNNLYRRYTALLIAIISLQFAGAHSAFAQDGSSAKPKKAGHRFGFGWLKRPHSNKVHKNGYSKNYHNPKP